MVASKMYEGMFLFDSNLAAKDWPGLEKHVQDLLQKNSAELVYSERWPDRKLSYEIRGMKKGSYYLTYFRAPPTAIQGIKRDTELSERVVRVLILHDETLEEDCAKRLSKEITGSPEEIEERREKLRRETQEPGRDLTGGPPISLGEPVPERVEEAL
jgi:small subunit ribosomal protein S6